MWGFRAFEDFRVCRQGATTLASMPPPGSKIKTKKAKPSLKNPKTQDSHDMLVRGCAAVRGCAGLRVRQGFGLRIRVFESRANSLGFGVLRQLTCISWFRVRV